MRLAFVFALASIALPALAADETTFEAGFARIDVTPQEPVRLSGYGNRNRPSDGVDTPLYARAMALRPASGETFVLVSFDTIGTPASFTDEVAKRLTEKHGIDRNRFVLAGTHSHTTPHLADGLSNLFATPLSDEEQQAAERYTARAKDAIVEAAGKAIADLEPATLSVGTGKAGFAMNRRVVKAGDYQGFGVTPQGAVDHTLGVLKIAAPTGELRGVVFNYACHATTLEGGYYRVNGDWPGYAARDVEEAHSGVTALSTIGCGADANPEPRGGDRAKEHSEAHGRALAVEVSKVIRGELAPVTAKPIASFGFAGLPFDRPTKAELEERQKSNNPQTARHAQNMLATLERMGRLPETYPMPVQTWQFGDALTMVFLGGEVVVDYAHRLKKELEPGHVWVTAYANDVFGYVASERIRSEGGYEVDHSMIYYNLPGRWSTGTEELLIKRVHEILKDPAGEPALSPDDAKQSFRLPEGFEIDLVASEPLIADPVNFAFGPDGRLWVVEMGDYPRGGDGEGAPAGKIKVLSDTDRDGVFDKATVFLDGLSFPNGVMPWREGALVSCAPDVFFARDTNGDGKADEREVLLTGFPEANPQHRVNGFAFGLDGLVHLAHGANGISSPKTGKSYDLAGRDFALDPDTGELVATSGDSQFGRCRDEWGNWFGNTNSNPLFQYVIEDRYLKRNPHVKTPDSKRHLIGGDERQVYPASRTVDRFNDLFALNRFTSACGPAVFCSDSFGAEWNGSAFTCEPVHNLVRCVRLTAEGVTFGAERVPTGAKEFLASTDPWCRPVRVATGPDGGLWVADMYRLVIEHPQWIPEAWQARLDLRAGADKGRIWRVRRSRQSTPPLPDLTAASTIELVARIDDPNGAVRDLAEQVFIWRADKQVIPPLRELARGAKLPQVRLQALGTLVALDALDADTARAALAADEPRLVQRAIELSEPLFGKDHTLGEAVADLAGHDDERVRFQVALSLGEWDNPRAAEALATLAGSSQKDPLLRAAVLSSASKHSDRILAAVLHDEDLAASIAADLVATTLGVDPDRGSQRVLDALSNVDSGTVPAWRMAAVASIAEAVPHKRRAALSKQRTVQHILRSARNAVSDESATIDVRRKAFGLLAGPLGAESDRDRLASLLVPQTSPELQEAVVEALSRSGDGDVPAMLLAGWLGHSPRLRSAIQQALFARPAWTNALLNAVDDGTLVAGDFDASARDRLLGSADSDVRAQAAKLFGAPVSADRSQLIAKYEPAQTLSGDAVRGRVLFEKTCASCHKLAGVGNEFGPNLAVLTDKSPAALLAALLDPNRAVEAKYRGYAVVTADGRVLTGLIVRESSGSITLAGADGRAVELLRKEIEELRDTGKSFMPEGLERDLSPQDVADVLAFVREARD